MDLRDTIAAILSTSQDGIFTHEEFQALTYQLQGSYDNKPVEILSKDLFHRKTLTAVTSIDFFDGNASDLTVSNVQGGQLPAGESYTVYELLLRFNPTVAAPPADLLFILEQFRVALFRSYITVGVKNKNPWIEIPGSRLLAGISGFQNIVEAAANTNSVAIGATTTVDLRYALSIPKVIGEKVNFGARIQFNTALAGAIVTSASELAMVLGGIDVRAR